MLHVGDDEYDYTLMMSMMTFREPMLQVWGRLNPLNTPAVQGGPLTCVRWRLLLAARWPVALVRHAFVIACLPGA